MMKEELVNKFNISPFDQNVASNDNGVRVTLEKLFRHIDHSDYPSLWNSVLRVRSVIAATVSCEHSFSCLNQTKHANTKIDNLCKIVDFRLSIKDSDGLKGKNGRILNRRLFAETDQRVGR